MPWKYSLSVLTFLRSKIEAQRSLLLCLVGLGLITAVMVLPYKFASQASSQKGNGLIIRTESSDPDLPNYDIRTAKGDTVTDFLASARGSLRKSAVTVADSRDEIVKGEDLLKERIPNAKVEYNDLRLPEVITPDVTKAEIGFLSRPSNEKRSEILRGFIRDNNRLIGVNEFQADNLKVTADYTNPAGNMSYAHLEQEINGVPVFRAEVKAGFTKDGQIVRIINNLAPGLDYSELSMDFGDPAEAVRAAAANINYELKPSETEQNRSASNGIETVFGKGDWAPTAEKVYFATEPGVAVPAWRVLIWQPVNAFYLVVDARSGTVL